eukprot:907028-Pleurochrysis_carterae.AAC.3
MAACIEANRVHRVSHCSALRWRAACTALTSRSPWFRWTRSTAPSSSRSATAGFNRSSAGTSTRKGGRAHLRGARVRERLGRPEKEGGCEGAWRSVRCRRLHLIVTICKRRERSAFCARVSSRSEGAARTHAPCLRHALCESAACVYECTWFARLGLVTRHPLLALGAPCV